MKNNIPQKIEYLPVYHYKGRRSGVLTGMYSVAVELLMNSFGKKKTIFLNKSNGRPHLEGRGDIHHRRGGILSVTDHNQMVDRADANRDQYLKVYQSRKASGRGY